MMQEGRDCKGGLKKRESRNRRYKEVDRETQGPESLKTEMVRRKEWRPGINALFMLRCDTMDKGNEYWEQEERKYEFCKKAEGSTMRKMRNVRRSFWECRK